MDAWGHTLTVLIGNLPSSAAQPSETLVNYARMLDKHYIPTHYPNGFASGAPTDFYTAEEARNAIQHAEAILGFCRDQID
jgi:HEPN domain-containing protein